MRKVLLQRLLFGSGLWTDRASKPARIAELISKLRPRKSSFDLIRIGGNDDGGYLLPDDLDDIGALISPGVSYECGFDLDIAERGIDVHMADASVPGPPQSHPRFNFTKKFFDIFNSDDNVTIDAFCRGVTPGRDLLLQMDIEGAEYRVLASASEELMRRFRVMVIEFHDLDQLFSSHGFVFIESLFQKLLSTHEVVHIHPNNARKTLVHSGVEVPPILEMTFLRKDRGTFSAARGLYPHPLDRPCTPKAPETTLPRAWW